MNCGLWQSTRNFCWYYKRKCLAVQQAAGKKQILLLAAAILNYWSKSVIKIIQHIDIEGPGMFAEVFSRGGHAVKIIKAWENSEDLFFGIDDLEAVLFLGGPMNVYEEQKYPFLKQEDSFLKEIIRRDIPTLGICLGAQLIAKAAGASIKKSLYKEIGFSRVKLTEASDLDCLFENIIYPLEVFQWHEDTYDLPEGAVLLARSDACEHQAFRLKNNIYGLQFHCEITDSDIKDWSWAYLDNEDPQSDKKMQEMIEYYLKIKHNYTKQMAMIGYNFLKIIEKSRSALVN